MQKPDDYDLRNMQSFLGNKMMGHGNALNGPDMDIWGSLLYPEKHSQELVVLKAREGSDPFSRKASSLAIPLFKMMAWARFQRPNPAYGVITVREDIVFGITLCLTSFLASIVPVVSIVSLINLTDLYAKISAIVAFDVLLSICLMVFTEARRADIFAITTG